METKITPEEIQKWFDENIDKDCSASSAIHKFNLWVTSRYKEEIETLDRKILSLQTLCRMAEVPELLIESFSIPEVNEDDIKWAKDVMQALKNEK